MVSLVTVPCDVICSGNVSCDCTNKMISMGLGGRVTS